MTALLIENVRIFDPGSGLDAPDQSVALRDGVISEIGSAVAAPDGARTIDGRGYLCSPGFLDLRAHLGEPGNTRAETIESGLRSAAAGGFTTVVAMPDTQPVVDRVEIVELIKSRSQKAGPTRVLPAGAVSVGREGKRLSELAQLKAAGCVAFTDADRSIDDSQLLRYAFDLAAELGTPVFTHAQDGFLGRGGVMHEGLLSAQLGLRGIPGAAEVIGVARDLALAELTQARLHVSHVSTSGAADLIRSAKARGVPVTADVSPLHLRLTDEAVRGYDTRTKVFPPLRPAQDVEAMIEALGDGTIDAVATDHMPCTQLRKNTEFDAAASGAIGFETAAGVVFSLVESGHLTMERAVTCLTRGPARVLGSSLGRLATAGPADLVLIDPARKWFLTEGMIRSRSKNTPLMGAQFVGAVMMTVAGGEITFERERSTDAE